MPHPLLTRTVDLKVVLPLRAAALRPGCEPQDCTQETDAEAIHLATYFGDEVVAIASVFEQPVPPFVADDVPAGPAAWRLRGMAAHPDHRNRGAGAAALKAVINHVSSQDGDVLWCNARSSALSFYREHGFTSVGEEFTIEGIGPHYVMYLLLPTA